MMNPEYAHKFRTVSWLPYQHPDFVDNIAFHRFFVPVTLAAAITAVKRKLTDQKVFRR